MAKRALVSSMLVFRIFCLFALVGSVGILIFNKFTDSQGNEVTFKDVIAYRFVLSTAVIGAAYILVQLPFAVYYACTEKRMIREGYLPEFDFYGDKLISLLLATGVGAGFAVSFESKRFVNPVFLLLLSAGLKLTNDDRTKALKFYNWGIISTALLALGFVCMVIVSILSSINHSSSTKGFFF